MTENNSNRSFKINDFVWAKKEGMPSWPGRIINPPPNEQSIRPNYHYVVFFGKNLREWIPETTLSHHSENSFMSCPKKKTPACFRKAVIQIIEESDKASKKKGKSASQPGCSYKNYDLCSNVAHVDEDIEAKIAVERNKADVLNYYYSRMLEEKNMATKKQRGKNDLFQQNRKNMIIEAKIARERRKADSLNDTYRKMLEKKKKCEVNLPKPSCSRKKSPLDHPSPAVKQKTQVKTARQKTKEEKTKAEAYKMSYKKMLSLKSHRMSKKRNHYQNNHPKTNSVEKSNILHSNSSVNILSKDIIKKEDIQDLSKSSCLYATESSDHSGSNTVTSTLPDNVPLNILVPSEIVLSRNIIPRLKKIGFIGIGPISRFLVKHLINSGHDVTIWNEDVEECKELVRIGVYNVGTPKEVIENCDITFSYLPDHEDVEKVFFGKDSIMHALESIKSLNHDKGLVEMTTMDSKIAKRVGDAVTRANVRYLVAQFRASQILAAEASLVIICSGSKSLFHDCHSCFASMAKKHIHMSSDPEVAMKMNVIFNMFHSTVLANLGQSLALAGRSDTDMSLLIEILKLSPLSSPLFIENARRMLDRDYTPDTSLKDQHHYVQLGLNLADSVNQPMTIAAATNEVFNVARCRNFDCFDASSIFEAIKGTSNKTSK